MNKKNKKVALVLIICLVIFTVILFLTVGISDLRRKREKLYIVVDNDAMWVYKNQKWSTISKNDAKSYNWMAFAVYEGIFLIIVKKQLFLKKKF